MYHDTEARHVLTSSFTGALPYWEGRKKMYGDMTLYDKKRQKNNCEL